MRSTLMQNRILSHVLERAAEGTRALRTAARHPHPGRIAYLAAGAVSVAAAATRSLVSIWGPNLWISSRKRASHQQSK